MPTSSSEEAYAALDLRLQRWIFEQNWGELRDIQQLSIPVLLEGDEDVILAATTSSGKTEAAFLPLLSKISRKEAAGVRLLYISPLRALINDQLDRLEGLAGCLDLPVTPWHGDVDQRRKTQVVREPAGLLLITPESLESLLGNHWAALPAIFEGLEAVVIDELHAFLDSERGRQLQSIMTRLETAIRRRIRRVGLSATLGDMELASDFLRPTEASQVKVIISEEIGQSVKLSLKAYIDDPEKANSEPVTAARKIAGQLFQDLRSAHHLVFANSRSKVEFYASVLAGIADENHLPVDFFPHHGSLSRDIREDAEARLKDSTRPATAVCTSTLELGIDIGSVESIAQVGPAPSVASLRQRLGRSGRRGASSILRVFVEETDTTVSDSLYDALHPDLVRCIAQVELLLKRYVEAPNATALHLSTLVHQILALTCERGSVTAAEAYRILCKIGPFRCVEQPIFIEVLRAMGVADFLTQTHDGELVVGLRGEKVRSHYSFYTVFQTPEEFRIVTDGAELGTLPITYPVAPEMTIVFAGRPWLVVAVEPERKIIKVVPAKGGKIPEFSGSSGFASDQVCVRERATYLGVDLPAYLDEMSKTLLSSARLAFRASGLDKRPFAVEGDELLYLPFKGTRCALTLQLLFQREGISAMRFDSALQFKVKDISAERLVETAKRIVSQQHPKAEELVAKLQPRQIEKYHWVLPDQLLNMDLAQHFVDIDRAWDCLKILAQN